jgi:VPDSG-CTERM motif
LLQAKKNSTPEHTKNLTKTILAVLAAGLVTSALSTQEAQAAKINGKIDFAGATQFDSKSLANATRVVKWRDVNGNLGFSNVADVTGNFSSIALGTKATMATSWIFSPSTPTPGLWSVGGFTFNLLSSTVVTQTSTFLNITGTGILSGNGFDPTEGAWAFTSQNAFGKHTFFSFSANAASVPDGGSAVSLLTCALLGLAALRRKVSC